MSKVKVIVMHGKGAGEVREVPQTASKNMAYMPLEDFKRGILLGEITPENGTKEGLLEMVESHLTGAPIKKVEPETTDNAPTETKPKRKPRQKKD